MRYAVIADVHGNLPALELVLEDARKNQVDSYIFGGDYCLNNPYPDECVTRMREIEPRLVIRGNGEAYLENLVGKDPAGWTDGQMQISYFCYRHVSPENRHYLLSCPEEIHIKCHGVPVHIAHSSGKFIADSEWREWSPMKVAKRYSDESVSRERLRKEIADYFDGNDVFQERLRSLPEGIYIFGHSHIQWTYRSEDGKRVLINPGSCGLPVECIRDSIPYTILDISKQGEVSVQERRLPFDLKKYAATFPDSAQYVEANVWSRLVMKDLETAREYLCFFLKFTEEYARRIGDTRRPFSLSTWEKAYEEWEFMSGDKEGKCS